MINRFIFNIDITISDGSFKEHEYILLETHDNGVPKKNRYAALYFNKIISLINDMDKSPKNDLVEEDTIVNKTQKNKKGGKNE